MGDSVVCKQAGHEAGDTAAADGKDMLAWIAERHAERHGPAQMFNAMRDSGWARDDAVAVLLEALPCELHEEVRALLRAAGLAKLMHGEDAGPALQQGPAG
jgi:hypothetical protein